MTKEQKINWLQNATAEEFLKHYNSTLLRYHRFNLKDDPEIPEDWELTKAEMQKRLGK
jgi:predicted metal-binding protein